MLEDTLRTLAYAFRSLRNRPVVTLASICLLSLGIGTAATFGGILNRIFGQPPAHIQKPEEVVYLSESRGGFSYPAYLDVSEASSGLGPTVAYQVDTFVAKTGSVEREMRVAMVTPGYFSLLGTPVQIGRYFAQEDAGQSTIVISYSLWQEAFGGRSDVLGQEALIVHKRYAIIGVAPRGFRGISPSALSLWVPLTDAPGQYGNPDYQYSQENHWLNLLLRLRATIPLEDVARRMADVVEAREGRQQVSVRAFRLIDLGPARTGAAEELFFLLATLSGVVLLACCVNVSALVLMQVQERSREAAIRAALGADRMSLVKGFLVEVALLALAGGALGGILSFWMASAFRNHILPADFSPWELLDARMGALILGMAFFSALLAGLFPALQTGKPDLAGLINTDCGVAKGRKSRAQQALASAQIALAFVLLVQASLLIRSLSRWRAVDFGFDYEHTLVAEVDYKSAGYSLADIMSLNEQITRELRMIPQVRLAAYSYSNPFNLKGPIVMNLVMLPDGHIPGSIDGKSVSYGPKNGPIPRFVSPGYLSTLGIKMLAGREFNESDLVSDAPSLVLSKKMVDFLWPGEKIENALGKCVIRGRDTKQCSYVVGVAQDVLYSYSAETQYAQNIYYVLPSRNEEKVLSILSKSVSYFVDSRSELGETTLQVRNAISQAVPGLSDAYIKVESTQIGVLGRRIAPWEFAAVGTTYFGILTFLVSLVGLSGNLTQFILQRKREVAIRLALGASPTRVLLSTIWQGLRTSLVGGGTGVLVSIMTSSFFKRFHFELGTVDMSTVVAVAVLVVLLTGVACIAPAYRIVRMQPAEILRE